MTRLVIHAPSGRKTHSGRPKTSFAAILASGVGPRYAICEKGVKNLPDRSEVVLLDKVKKRRAEGVLVNLAPTGTQALPGVYRYDVHFNDAAVVPYKSETLNRCGVAVYDTGSGVHYCRQNCT